MPTPQPPVGGIPYESASTKSGSPGSDSSRAGLALGLLHREPLRLLLAVVQLAERVRELHPGDDALEPLDERLVLVRRARERRELDRPVVDDRRLDQLRLDEVRVRVVDELRPRDVARRVDARVGELLAQLVLVARPDALLLERLDEAQPRCQGGASSISWPRNVTFVVPIAPVAARSTSCSVRTIVSR